MKVYAIKDNRTKEYEQILCFPHVAEATRFFEDIANNPQSRLSKWPQDYQLDQLGDFDSKQGTFTNEWKEVCQISDLKKSVPHNNNDPVEAIRRLS